MKEARFPSLYQIHTRIWLYELSRTLRRPVTLADVPDSELEQIAAHGFDWVWLLGVWQTGPAGRQVSATQPHWRREFLAVLPDLHEDDICGSPFAIRSYTVHADFGGPAALENLRRRLQRFGLKLLLDFVPNHTALDHPWLDAHPEFFITGTADDLARQPQNYRRMETPRGSLVLAHGRDPYFDGWPDTLQLNYRHPTLRASMIAELERVADQCDGVRCDMAMLVLPEIFAQTWGAAAVPRDGSRPADTSFWPEAIACVRQQSPRFLFMAEVYWDLEGTLQQQGFDYTYDKRLYDRLHAEQAATVRGHLQADAGFHHKSVRFLENHDEPRAASAFPHERHAAAAVITYLVPGLRFFHEGQLSGRTVKASLHLRRRPVEAANVSLHEFYSRLLVCLRRPEVRTGNWQLLTCRPAWDGNGTWDQFIAFLWEGDTGQRLLVTVNYGPTRGQCYVGLPFADLESRTVRLHDLFSPACYERDDLMHRGLYLDLPPWGFHVFELASQAANS